MRKKIIITAIYCLLVFSMYAQSTATFNGTMRGISSTSNGNQVTYQTGTLNNSIINLPTKKGVQHFPLDFDKTPYLRDTSLNYFEIGHIPDQTVISGGLLNFYVKCDSIKTGNKSYSITSTLIPGGVMYFKPTLQYFHFEPLVTDTVTFYIFFKATNGIDTITQKVLFKTYRPAYINNYTFGVGNGQQIPDPTAKEYQLVTTVNNQPELFNGITRPTRTVSISAIDLTAENISSNLLMTLSNNEDIKELNIYAERLFIKDTLNFPQTKVNIYCKELYFQNVSGRSPAAINTTPKKLPAAFERIPGLKGATAGVINVFANKIIDDNGGIRFRMIGGDGQNATNAQAGDGGDGGNLFSNINILYKGDYLAGLAGTPSGDSGVLARNNKGKLGTYLEDSIQQRWINANYIRQILSFSEDAYYLGYQDSVINKLKYYDIIINKFIYSNEFSALDNYTQSDLMQVDMEVVALISRVQSGLDYFGNPPGWVPMLSFEFSQAAFESELHHAMQILYLNYFISSAADSLQKRIDGYTALRDELKNQSLIDKANFNNLLSSVIPDVENRISENDQDLQDIQQHIKDVTAELALRADRQLEDQRRARDKPSWEKIVGGIATVCTFIPYPPLQAVGAGVNAGLALYNGIKKIDNFNLNNVQSIIGTGEALYGAFDNAQKVYNSYNLTDRYNQSIGTFNDIKSQWQNFFPVFQGFDSISGLVAQVKRGQTLFGSLTSVVKDVTTIYDDFLKVDNNELKAIRSNILANDPVLAQLNESLKETSEKHKKLVDEYNSTNDQIQVLASQIVGSSLAFDNANTKVLNNVKVLDHRTVHYIQYLRQDALRRLKKYNYYMAKAYEFRTLQPYIGNLNITPILTSAESMAIASGNGTLTTSQYNTLGDLYRNQISQVAENIYDYYQANAPSQTQRTTYVVPKSEIIELNKSNKLYFNPINKGLFRNDEENIRIVNVHVIRLKDSTGLGSLGSTSNIDVKFEYPNESYVKSKGKVYYFNNYNLSTTTPIIWSTRYDKNNNGTLVDSKPSESTTSLLQSLLISQGIPVNSKNLLMYSRPSAGAEILLSSSPYNSNGTANLYIDSLLIEVEYDYNTKPVNISYLDIQAEPDWIVPQYLLSKADNNTMQDGQGNMIRSYTTSSANSVRVKTQSKIGGYRFDRWLDKYGRPILDADSINPQRTFKMDSARFNRVKYKWAGPILSLPDTLVFVDLRSLPLSIHNAGESYMFWVVDTITSNITINGNIKKGYDDTTLTISVSNPLSGVTGYIAFIAPDAENAVDTVWIKRPSNPDAVKSQLSESIRVYPNPAANQLFIETNGIPITEINIYDVSGILVLKEKPPKDKLIDISGLQNGIYIAEIKTKNSTVMKKWIKM